MLAITRFRRAKRKAEEGEEAEAPTLRERGAALLEFALIAPLFFLVVFGGIEIGYMFRNNLALEDSVRNAARVAAVQRNDLDADKEILISINSRVGDLNGDVKRVVIFAPETLNGQVTDDCKDPLQETSLQGDNRCNVYVITDGDIQAEIDTFALENGINNNTERGPGASIGVYIEYDYEYVTGFFDKITLSSESVQAIELGF